MIILRYLKLALSKIAPRWFNYLYSLAEVLNDRTNQRDHQNKLRKSFPNLVFSNSSYISLNCQFIGQAVVGSNTMISKCIVGKYTYFAGDLKFYFCSIGHYCSIGPGVLAGLGIHPSRNFVSTHPLFFSTVNKFGTNYIHKTKINEAPETIIGNDVWIGAGVMILSGIKIGDGAIIGAGSIVTHDVEPYSIVAGTPAKEIRKRFNKEQIEFLINFGWWNKPESWIIENADLFDDIEKFIVSNKNT